MLKTARTRSAAVALALGGLAAASAAQAGGVDITGPGADVPVGVLASAPDPGVDADIAAATATSTATSTRLASPEDRYAMAGGCYALRSNATGGYVVRSGDGYATDAADITSAEPFHLQATDLGSYLLFGKASDFLADRGADPAAAAVGAVAGGGPGQPAVAAPKASPAADWEVDGSPDAGFTLRLPEPGRALVAGPGNRLRVADAASPSAAGGAGRFSFTVTDGCADWPEVEIGVEGEPAKGSSPHAEVRGLLETHMHGMAFEFLGGRARCGRPWHPYGVTEALVDCPDHEPGGAGAVLEAFLSKGSPVAPHDTTGWPTFRDWPAWDSLTHEQAYHRWIERAWRGGLRLYVNLLVDNTALCQVYPYKRNSCNEMDGVRLQAQRLHELQDYIDAQAGGPGEGWFRIVRDPVEAREVINAGKLAVVMGIEVSVLFDCGERLDVPMCTEDEIDVRMDEVYDMGVRQMELVNKFDNALTGVAGDSGTTGVVVNSGNKLVTGHFWDMRTCPADEHGHEHGAHDRRQLNPIDDGLSHMPGPSEDRDVLAGAVLSVFGATTRGAVAPVYPKGPHCNDRGLTQLGEHVVRSMLAKGMIIDPDHMSAKARAQLLDVLAAEDRRGGLMSSHSWSDEPSMARIYELGGLVTPYAGDTVGFLADWQRYKQLATERAPEGTYFGFGRGADINGFGKQGPPRNPTEENDVDYPFAGPLGDVVIDRQVSGERIFDINTDGVAHYGLYPDWLEDLRVLAGPRGDELVEDMLRGAEAYLRQWERAAGGPSGPCVSPQDRLDPEDAHALLGDRPLDAIRRLGQPQVRDDRYFEWCEESPSGIRSRLRITFYGGERIGRVERLPGS